MSEPLEGGIPGFDIKRTIAKGGMATVYLAVQHSPNRVVALKLLNSTESTEDGEDRETLIDRFRQEGEIVSRIDHPHIIDVYGVGHTDSALYIYMEYLGGGDLAARIESGMTPLAALEIVSALGKALAYAHDKGVVHRDVKPSNVLFRRDGTVLLSDFGIAKRLNSGTEITTVGMLLGSPVYMSPEQVQGRPLDGRTDIYSLGVMLYEMLSGRPPFNASSPLRVMMMHARDPVPSLPPALRAFTPLCERLLAKDADQRIRSGTDVVSAVEELRAALDKDEGLYASPVFHGDRKSGSPITTTEVTDSILQGLLEDLSKDRLALPTPRGIAQHVINIVDRPVVDRDVVAKAIVLDPALTAQVLRIANSAFYERAGEVLSIDEAVALMGSQSVGNVVSLLSISQVNEARLDPTFQEQLNVSWRAARQVSHLSSMLAPGAGIDAHLARVVGLVHNLGALALGVWAEQIPHLANNGTRLASVAKRLRHTVTTRIFEQWQVSGQLVAALDEFVSLRSPPERMPGLGDCVAAAWLLVQYHDTSAFLASDAMRAEPIEKLRLDEAEIFYLMAERTALDKILDAQLRTHND